MPTGYSLADTLLTGGIGIGGIEEGYAQVQASFDHGYRFILVESLNRYAAETQSGDEHISFAEPYLFQLNTSPAIVSFIEIKLSI